VKESIGKKMNRTYVQEESKWSEVEKYQDASRGWNKMVTERRLGVTEWNE
jgi:hypothetical protein